MVNTWHLSASGLAPPVIEDAVEDERLPEPLPAPVSEAPVRLAVCPCCRTVSELEPGHAEPIKLMVCWRCAKQHPGFAFVAPPAPEPPPSWLNAPERERKLVGGYGMLIVLVLGCGFVASQLWFETRTPAPGATGVVPVIASDESSASQADATAGTAASELVRNPPSAGPVVTATPSGEPVPAPAPAPAPARPSARARAPAQAPQGQMACTPGAAALGLCSPGTMDGKP
jgi:hypothetical protein